MAGCDYLNCVKCDSKAVYNADWFERVDPDEWKGQVEALCPACAENHKLAVVGIVTDELRAAIEVLREFKFELEDLLCDDGHDIESDAMLIEATSFPGRLAQAIATISQSQGD